MEVNSERRYNINKKNEQNSNETIDIVSKNSKSVWQTLEGMQSLENIDKTISGILQTESVMKNIC